LSNPLCSHTHMHECMVKLRSILCMYHSSIIICLPSANSYCPFLVNSPCSSLHRESWNRFGYILFTPTRPLYFIARQPNSLSQLLSQAVPSSSHSPRQGDSIRVLIQLFPSDPIPSPRHHGLLRYETRLIHTFPLHLRVVLICSRFLNFVCSIHPSHALPLASVPMQRFIPQPGATLCSRGIFRVELYMYHTVYNRSDGVWYAAIEPIAATG
jgi:hypothetical protein